MKMGFITAAVLLCLYLGMLWLNFSRNLPTTFNTEVKFSVIISSTDISEARRHPKIVIAPPNGGPIGPILGLKKEFEFHEYDLQGGNVHPADDDTVEIGPPVREQEHEQEAEQHERERERAHAHAQVHGREHDRHDSHREHQHQHHDHIHIHHQSKSISHHHSHHPKPGYSAGSGLRSIAQGSADQASSAVSNQVSFYCELKRDTCLRF